MKKLTKTDKDKIDNIKKKITILNMYNVYCILHKDSCRLLPDKKNAGKVLQLNVKLSCF